MLLSGMAEAYRYWRLAGHGTQFAAGTYPIDDLPAGVSLFGSNAVRPADAPDDWEPPADSWEPVGLAWVAPEVGWIAYDFGGPKEIAEIKFSKPI